MLSRISAVLNEATMGFFALAALSLGVPPLWATARGRSRSAKSLSARWC